MIDFIRKNKGKLILSSLLILLPALVGLFLWDSLPDTMTTHWGADKAADGWSSKTFAVIGMPLLLLAMHWFCILFTAKDPGNRDQSGKALGLIFWILPAASLLCMYLVYGTALGQEMNMDTLLPAGFAVMLLSFGNYMPKIKQNRTLGIKVHWALHNEENWNATHRFGGKLWVAGGFVILIALFLPDKITMAVMFLVTLIVAVAPVVYSWLYSRKQAGKGIEIPKKTMTREEKIWSLLAAGICCVVFVLVLLLMVTGNITFRQEGTELIIQADYYDDLVLDLTAVDSVELIQENVPGSRVNGFGSPRLSLGIFENDEYGTYLRYTYTGAEACIVLVRDGEYLVIAEKTAEQTAALYEQLRKVLE